ncbi:DNA-directed RNA polymerase subunit delta [Aquibacillus saliphilus]|uniref:DNA-directed RNA polymerase subunit delta n=1 Tax=Aquibacillus saliphilus TaxID=1909422 RepID=UPI001CF02020
MGIKDYTKDHLETLSMIQMANEILIEENKATDFREMFDRIAKMKKFTKAQKDENIAQFYTDMNTDGRFMTIGSGLWGLKNWYPIEQIEEELTAAPKKKKKKKAAAPKRKKKKKVEVFEEEDLDLDEEALDFDDTDIDDYDDADDESDDDESVDDDYDSDFDDDDDDDDDSTDKKEDDDKEEK